MCCRSVQLRLDRTRNVGSFGSQADIGDTKFEYRLFFDLLTEFVVVRSENGHENDSHQRPELRLRRRVGRLCQQGRISGRGNRVPRGEPSQDPSRRPRRSPPAIRPGSVATCFGSTTAIKLGRVIVGLTRNFGSSAQFCSVPKRAFQAAPSGRFSTSTSRSTHRTTRRSRLTGEGELFYERATQILTDVAAARNMFGGLGQVPRGQSAGRHPRGARQARHHPAIARVHGALP